MPEGPLNARRILVYGVTGSGKTTLARRLSEVTGIRWYSVDDHTWEPGWVTVPVERQRAIFAEICAGEEWILDTAYGAWLDIPLERVEMIVCLDYPRWLSFARLFRRTMLRLVDGRPICNGNRERLSNLFSRDCILIWHWRSFARKRSRIDQWSAAPDGPIVVRHKMPADAERWLAAVRLGRR